MSAPVVVTAESFERQVLDATLPVVVEFGADWCVPCRMVAPVLAELAQVYAGRLRFATVDTDAEQELARRYGIVSIPTLYVFHEGDLLRSLVGAREKRAYAAELDDVLAEIG